MSSKGNGADERDRPGAEPGAPAGTSRRELVPGPAAGTSRRELVPGPASGTSRRELLLQLAAAGAAPALLGEPARAAAELLAPVIVQNPLDGYPDRSGERRHRERLREDSSFSFLCESADGHGCNLTASVRDGAVVRIGPGRGHGKALGPGGERASGRWDPRCCPEGLSRGSQLERADRATRPLVRQGFRAWARAGFPRDAVTGAVDPRYLRRGAERFEELSWDEALRLTASALVDVARTFGGDAGRRRLLSQGHDPLLVEATRGAGTQTLKLQAAASGVGLTRAFALHRLAGSLALLDDHLRGEGPAASLGGRTWRARAEGAAPSPGHWLVTGEPTAQLDLCDAEEARLVLLAGACWGGDGSGAHGPDARWLSAARLRGAHVVALGSAQDPAASHADELLLLRPGTCAALALGLSQQLLAEGLHDVGVARRATDLPLLVRLDTGELLRAEELVPPGPAGAHVVFDERLRRPVAVPRDALGRKAPAPATASLEGGHEVRVARPAPGPGVAGSSEKVRCRPVLGAIRELLDGSYRPEDVERLTSVPAATIRSLARRIAGAKGRVLILVGEELHELLHADLTDRALFLLSALSGSVAGKGAGVGSLTGPGRAARLPGLAQFVDEDPFAPELYPGRPAPVRRCSRPEPGASGEGEPLLRAGATLLTGQDQLPTPTKALVCCEPGSLLSEETGHAGLLRHALPGVDLVAVCTVRLGAATARADVIFPLDGPLERKQPDLVLSSSSPFLLTSPVTPLPRRHDTRSELEVAACLGAAIGKLTRDPRHGACWQFAGEAGRPYLQRILDGSQATTGLRLPELERQAAAGVPALLRAPELAGERPWPTRTGRLELYRGEAAFRDAGENLPVHREPIDATLFEPNVIVASPHPLLRPRGPASYGLAPDDLRGDARQARHVVRSVEELLATRHPLFERGHRFVLLRREQPAGDGAAREGHLALHPGDAELLGVQDGDLVFVFADPDDRPSRLLVPVRRSGAPRPGVALLVGPRGATFPGGEAGSCSRTFRKPALCSDDLAASRAGLAGGLELGPSGSGPTRSEALVRIERAPAKAGGR